MAAAGYKGTSYEQDWRYADKQKKLKQQLKFPPEFEHAVDVSRVRIDVLRPWVAEKITEILGFEDEVVIELVFNTLTSVEKPDPRDLQINLTGFLEKQARPFVKELWKMLLSAQSNPNGIPEQLLEAKKQEIQARQVERQRLQEEIRRKQEQPPLPPPSAPAAPVQSAVQSKSSSNSRSRSRSREWRRRERRHERSRRNRSRRRSSSRRSRRRRRRPRSRSRSSERRENRRRRRERSSPSPVAKREKREPSDDKAESEKRSQEESNERIQPKSDKRSEAEESSTPKSEEQSKEERQAAMESALQAKLKELKAELQKKQLAPGVTVEDGQKQAPAFETVRSESAKSPDFFSSPRTKLLFELLPLFEPTIDLICSFAYECLIAIAYDDCVRLFDSELKYKQTIGGKGSALGEFNGVYSIAFDSVSQTLFASDFQNHRVQAFNLDGKFLFSFGKELCYPSQLAISPNHSALAVATGHPLFCRNQLVLFELDGSFMCEIDLQAKEVRGLAWLSSQEVVICDSIKQSVEVLNVVSCQLIATVDSPIGWVFPCYAAVNWFSRQFFIADSHANSVDVFALEGFHYLFTIGASEQTALRGPQGMAVDELGRVFVVDSWARELKLFDCNGSFLYALSDLGLLSADVEIIPIVM